MHGEAEFTTTEGETGAVGDVELGGVVSSEDVDVADLSTVPADGQAAPAADESLATSATPPAPIEVPAPPAPEVPVEAAVVDVI